MHRWNGTKEMRKRMDREHCKHVFAMSWNSENLISKEVNESEKRTILSNLQRSLQNTKPVTAEQNISKLQKLAIFKWSSTRESIIKLFDERLRCDSSCTHRPKWYPFPSSALSHCALSLLVWPRVSNSSDIACVVLGYFDSFSCCSIQSAFIKLQRSSGLVPYAPVT